MKRNDIEKEIETIEDRILEIKEEAYAVKELAVDSKIAYEDAKDSAEFETSPRAKNRYVNRALKRLESFLAHRKSYDKLKKEVKTLKNQRNKLYNQMGYNPKTYERSSSTSSMSSVSSTSSMSSVSSTSSLHL
jgi:hypothetical protein